MDCPWKISLSGWLGGNDPHLYSDSIPSNNIQPCRNHDFSDDPEHGVSAPCIGALQCASNSGTMLNDEEMEAARKTVGKNDEVFKFFWEFHKYHTGEMWLHPLMRK
jgi:hypothetical protein